MTHSLRFVMTEQRFTLKTICSVMILIDLFLIPIIVEYPMILRTYFYLVVYEFSVIFSFMMGMRGQGRYKLAMMELQAIARDRDLSLEQRERMLVQGIHHQCLELGYIYEERNQEYGLRFKKKQKKHEVDIE